jgi:hypothetical protein
MRLIFLDIDGVLNTPESREATGQDVPTFLSWLPGAVKNLKKIVKQTDAEIVIASSWRFPKYIHALGRAFEHFDLPQWIDTIPYLKHHPSDKRRGKEIKQFLKNFDEPVDSYVILDDKGGDRLKKKQRKHHLIHVDENVGLTKEDALKAIKILKTDEQQ